MHIFRQLEDIPVTYRRTVVSVGNFDGVHRAHVEVLSSIVRRAQICDARSVAICFEPHPTRVLRPNKPTKLITPTAEKLRLLELTGVDAVLLLPFTHDVL